MGGRLSTVSFLCVQVFDVLYLFSLCNLLTVKIPSQETFSAVAFFKIYPRLSPPLQSSLESSRNAPLRSKPLLERSVA